MKKVSRPVTGVHYLAEVYNTKPEVLGRLKVPDMRRKISRLVKRSGFHELGRSYFPFPGGGMTGIVSLSESHIAFHTWPELGYTTLDVYTCNYRKNNRWRSEGLFQGVIKLFSSKESRVKTRKILR